MVVGHPLRPRPLNSKPKTLQTQNPMKYSEYAALPGLRASDITEGRLSMLHMHRSITNTKPDTDAMRWGRLVHAAILEPQEFRASVRTFDGRRAGKDWQEFAAENDPEWIVKTSELVSMIEISESVHGHEFAHKLISRTQHEASIQWDDVAVGPCKARLDAYSPEIGLVEIKTTNAIEPRRFQSTFAKFGYHLQMGWHAHGVRVQDGRDPDCHMIVIESQPPYDVIVYHIPSGLVRDGYGQAYEIASKYRECERENRWPGVSDSTMEFELPLWAFENPNLQIAGEKFEL